MKVKDLLKVIDDVINVMIFSKEGYCGVYTKHDRHNCYFNEWYITNIETDTCYSEPTIVIYIQKEMTEDED